MKIIANDYSEKEIMKIIRKWINKKQTELGKDINLSGMTIQGYERGVRKYSFETLMKIARSNDITITIEKNNNP